MQSHIVSDHKHFIAPLSVEVTRGGAKQWKQRLYYGMVVEGRCAVDVMLEYFSVINSLPVPSGFAINQLYILDKTELTGTSQTFENIQNETNF